MRTRGLQPSLGEVARYRQGGYRLLSALLLDPDEKTVAVLAEAASYLRQRGAWAAALAFYGPWDRFLRCVDGLTPREAQESYRSVFGGAPRTTVPLHESAYLDQSTTASGWLLARLEQEYAAAGRRLSPAQAEASDHAAVELEFVSFLCGLEAEAWEGEEMQEAIRAIRRQRRFLEQHLCQWLPCLAQAVIARDDSGLYRLLAEAAYALAAHDVDFLEVLATDVAVEAGAE